MPAQIFLRKLRTRVLPNLHHLPMSRVRRCGCCEKMSLFVSFSLGEEWKVCVRCHANPCFELIATYLRENHKDLNAKEVLELDPHSPLRPLLSRAKTYCRSYYSNTESAGSTRPDGARCEDITRLSLPDNAVDLIVSRDVLEHVPNLDAAFSETARVLRPGGQHIFTVPTHAHTLKRADIIDGQIVHLVEPEYHSDPLDPAGILAFWDFGMDAAARFSREDLKLEIAAGPVGLDQRILWRARKLVPS